MITKEQMQQVADLFYALGVDSLEEAAAAAQALRESADTPLAHLVRLSALPRMNARGEIRSEHMTPQHLATTTSWQFWDVMSAMRGRPKWTAHEYDPDDMMDVGWGTHWRPAVYAAIYGDGPPLSSAPEIGEQRATSHDEATILSELYGILGVDSLAGAVGAARAGVDNEATLAELISTSTAERDEALARLESLRAELDALRRDRAMLCEAIAPGTFVGSVAAHTQRARQLRESLRHNLRSDFPKPGLVQRLADGDQELEEDVPL